MQSLQGTSTNYPSYIWWFVLIDIEDQLHKTTRYYYYYYYYYYCFTV